MKAFSWKYLMEKYSSEAEQQCSFKYFVIYAFFLQVILKIVRVADDTY